MNKANATSLGEVELSQSKGNSYNFLKKIANVCPILKKKYTQKEEKVKKEAVHHAICTDVTLLGGGFKPNSTLLIINQLPKPTLFHPIRLEYKPGYPMRAAALGDRVYVPDENLGWVKAEILKDLPENKIEIEIKADQHEESNCHPKEPFLRIVEKTNVQLQNENLNENGCDDMIQLSYLHEPAILFNLQNRFLRKNPYTNTGPICIAVNPYQWLDIYQTKHQNVYLSETMNLDDRKLPPHIYATSAASYRHMRTFEKNQSILVSGESGAGKTETTKLLMSHLAVAGGAKNEKNKKNDIIERVLQANPLLESFGNAKTSRNDNSSRFGKFTELQFDKIGRLIGSKCRTYLLEKSRVTTQGIGERNYHIFYQIFEASKDLRQQVFLDDDQTTSFPFLQQSSDDVNIYSDEKHYMNTVNALDTLGISKMDQVSMFQVISSVLHLGVLRFGPTNDDEEKSSFVKTSHSSEKSIKAICEMLQVTSEKLEQILCTRQMKAGMETYVIPRSVEQSQNIRAAMAVALYSTLFDWLVHRINTSTSARNDLVENRVCILDIFGFESFEVNSFEQLCINYANEKLQEKFLLDTFKSVEEEYLSEGIPWTQVNFMDNRPIIELIEGRFGLFALLNEECNRPKGNDSAFVNKLKAHFNENEFITMSRFGENSFTIHHYAGKVNYCCENFRSKNTDASHSDLTYFFANEAQNLFLKNELFHKKELSSNKSSGGEKHRHRRGSNSNSILMNTIATGFKGQLHHLLQDIRATNVHYVRCIKPNTCKSNFKFNKLKVSEQLRAAGVVQAVEASRSSFPNKLTMKKFIQRFRLLALSTFASSDVRMSLLDESDEVDNYQRSSFYDGRESFIGGGRTSFYGRYSEFGSRMSSIGGMESFGDEDSDAVSDMCKLLLSEVIESSDDDAEKKYVCGKTKVYFGMGVLEALEEKRSLLQQAAVAVLQRNVRTFIMYNWYQRNRMAAVFIQQFIRTYLSRQFEKKKIFSAILIQSLFRQILSKKRVTEVRQKIKAIKIQSFWRMKSTRNAYTSRKQACMIIQRRIKTQSAKQQYQKLLSEKKEEAQLENQILRLKEKLLTERQAREKLESQQQQAVPTVSTTNAMDGVAEALLDQLQREKQALLEANIKLKESNAKLKLDKENVERGAYVNGVSFAAANQRAIKLQQEMDFLKTAHNNIKNTHKTLRAQNMSAMEQILVLKSEARYARENERKMRKQYEGATRMVNTLRDENTTLIQANGRLRLILRQDSSLRQRIEAPLHKNQLFTANYNGMSTNNFSSKSISSAVNSTIQPQEKEPEPENMNIVMSSLGNKIIKHMIRKNSCDGKSNSTDSGLKNGQSDVKTNSSGLRQPTGQDGPVVENPPNSRNQILFQMQNSKDKSTSAGNPKSKDTEKTRVSFKIKMKGDSEEVLIVNRNVKKLKTPVAGSTATGNKGNKNNSTSTKPKRKSGGGVRIEL